MSSMRKVVSNIERGSLGRGGRCYLNGIVVVVNYEQPPTVFFLRQPLPEEIYSLFCRDRVCLSMPADRTVSLCQAAF